MTHDANPDAAARRDRQIERYILALDRGDFDTVAEILAAAETDPELDRLLVEVDGALHAEAQLTTQAEEKKAVLLLLRKHLPSAFGEAETGPPTVGQVATRLQADHDSGKQLLLPGDLHSNAQLVGHTVPLTGRLTPRTIRQATEPLGVHASDRYWELFRRAAGELALARAGAVHQAAARPRSSHRRRPADQDSEES